MHEMDFGFMIATISLRQADIHTYSQVDRQDKQTDRQTRETNRKTDKRIKQKERHYLWVNDSQHIVENLQQL